jgi:2'-5' RNA ligase
MLPVAGIDELAAAVVRATAHVGAPPDARPFRGHLTLAESRRGTPPKLDVELRATWPVTEVALVESQLHPAGARYETVHTVPLALPDAVHPDASSPRRGSPAAGSPSRHSG